MARLSPESWQERREAFERYAELVPRPSKRELASRLSWLNDVLSLARKLGRLEPLPFDSPEIREDLARIRV